MSLRFKKKKDAELTAIYNKWIKVEDGLGVKWIEKYVIELLASMPLNETEDDALQKWKLFTKNINTDFDREKVVLLMRDFGINFTARRESKDRQGAFKDYGSNLAAVIGQLHAIDSNNFSKMIIGKVEDSITQVSDAIQKNLYDEITDLQQELEVSIKQMKDCDEAVKQSTLKIKEYTEDINSLDVGQNAQVINTNLNKIRRELKLIAERCSKQDTMNKINKALEDLQINVGSITDLVTNSVSDGLQDSTETTPEKLPRLSLLQQIREGKQLKKIEVEPKKETNNLRENLANNIRKAMLFRRSAMVGDDENKSDFDKNDFNNLISCDFCSSKSVAFKCSCGEKTYCSKKCGFKDWKTHSLECNKQ